MNRSFSFRQSGSDQPSRVPPHGMENRETLKREVEILHRQFFEFKAPYALVDEYVRAHTELPSFIKTDDCELRTVRIVVDRGLDALGIEPWLRSGLRRHLLSRKLLLIAYLAECDGDHPEFREVVQGRLCSFAILGGSSVRAVARLLRGRLQMALYGLL